MAPKAVLVGLPGSGKSTIGRRLAKALNLTLLDTDAAIEETTGRLADGRYVSLGGIFPAWEGGRGGYDCEPLARPFPRDGVAFGTDLTFALARD